MLYAAFKKVVCMGCGASKSHDHGLLKESELKIGTNSLNDKEIASTKVPPTHYLVSVRQGSSDEQRRTRTNNDEQ